MAGREERPTLPVTCQWPCSLSAIEGALLHWGLHLEARPATARGRMVMSGRGPGPPAAAHQCRADHWEGLRVASVAARAPPAQCQWPAPSGWPLAAPAARYLRGLLGVRWHCAMLVTKALTRSIGPPPLRAACRTGSVLASGRPPAGGRSRHGAPQTKKQLPEITERRCVEKCVADSVATRRSKVTGHAMSAPGPAPIF